MGAGRRGARNKWVETWLNLVDFACEYGKLYAIGKGQGEGPINGGCRASLTEERVKDLEGMLLQ